MRLLLLDNYDSFTWNLAQYLQELGAEVRVELNDAIGVGDVMDGGYDGIVISPGPGRPEGAGITLELIQRAAGKIPLLGVCLGHQAIAQAYGARIVEAPTLMHGKTSPIVHDGSGVFEGLPDPFDATRYHSLVVEPASLDERAFVVNARTPEGVIMGLSHRSLALHGVQFHPESILTGEGKRLLSNFLGIVGAAGGGVRLPQRAIGGKQGVSTRHNFGGSDMSSTPVTPHNLKAWVEQNREMLKPPVGNKMVWKDSQFLVMIVGGPNQRKDFHIEDGEEFFYQIEGDITLRIMDEGKPRDISIKEGDIYLLPARVPHSPQRPSGTVGMVIERVRKPGELDHLRWYCEGCGEILHDAAFQLEDLGKQLKPIIQEFYASEPQRTCDNCGSVMQVPSVAK